MVKNFADLAIQNYGDIVYNNNCQEGKESPGEKGNDTMKKFEIGETYSMRSICDHNCVWSYTVVARTAQTITLDDGKKTTRCRISKKVSEYIKAETVFPLGQYSMAPSLSADKVA